MTKATRYWSMAAALLLVVVALPATAQAENGSGLQPHVVMPVKHGVSQPLRDLPTMTIEAMKPAEEVREVNPLNAEIPDRFRNAAEATGPTDPAVQNFHFDNNLPAPIVNFEGVNNRNGVYPPDTTGDVGLDHYIQWVNLSFQIFDKSGASVAGPFNGNVLWSGFGGSCQTDNYGDPIVLYDHMADRWLMTQFTGNNHQCIAVSQTGDPTGAWWLYDFLADAGSGYFNDYPKLGVWPDGYYFSANMFGGGFEGAMAGVFERDQMLNGDPAQFIWFFAPDVAAEPSWSILPADLDGLTLPPTGAPNPFLQVVADEWGYDPPYDVDALITMNFHVDWATPGNSTFGVTDVIDLTATYDFDPNMCGYARSCIPQPGTGQGLDSIPARPMYRLQYRNFGDYQTLVTSHTVDANGADHAGVRWYELRDSGSGFYVYQGATYAPDAEHRWMGDLAMDVSGDIAVGYSVSSSTVYPSIRWAGRLVGDPLNDLAQGEAEVMTGSGIQTGTAARWGDYSTMAVDPVDDCTFWYTQEYLETSGTAPWQTRIAAFKFPSCTQGPSGTVEGTVSNAATMLPIAGATVEVGPYATSTDGSGFYSILVPEDTYDVTASKFGFAPVTVNDVVVTDGMTTTQDFALTPNTTAGLDGYVTAELHGWPLYAMVELESGGMPVGTVFTDPFNGYYEFAELPISTPYDITVTSMIAGYDPAARGIVLDPAGQTESFVLANDGSAPWVQCAAVNGFTEDFDGGTFPPLGWSTINNGGACVWESTNTTGRTNFTGGSGAAADADSDWCGPGTTMNTSLISPIVDLSAATTTATFSWCQDYNDIGSADNAQVYFSTNGGATWTNLIGFTADDRTCWTWFADEVIAGSSQVRFRFDYFAPTWDWWYEVDDVVLTSDGGAPGFACNPVPGTLVEGFVSDANTAEGLVGADVSNDIGGMTTTVSTASDPSTPEGYYFLFTPQQLGEGPSTVTFTASASGYAESVVPVNPTPSTAYRLDFVLEAGWLEMAPDFLESRLYAGETENQPMSILNYGGIDADVSLLAFQEAGWVPSAPMDVITIPQLSPEQAAALTSQFVAPPELARTEPLAAGDVINSWPATGLTLPWGMGYHQFANNAWVSNPVAGGGDDLDYEFTAAGTATGNTIDTSGWIGSWAGDMTFDATTGMLWQVNVGGDNCIYELDPGAGVPTGNNICWGPITSERGVAYDPVSDTFFIGGWNSLAVTRFDRTGAVLQVANVGLAISGLAYNPVTEHLFVMTNAAPNLVYVLDVADAYNVIGSFAVPGFGDFSGAGLGISCDGHLWAVNQADGMVYEVDSGETGACLGGASLPWLVLTPDEGLVPGAGMTPGELPINAEFIADGAARYGLVQANISLLNNTPYDVNDTWVCFTKSFNDMTPASFGDAYVHSVAGAGITSGCGGGNFCPTNLMTRGVMARWLMLSKYGPDYSPPPCAGIFGDVSCEGTPNSDFIEALYNEGITAGCSASPLLYCPNDAVTRAQMAVFLLKTLEGSDYVPPACGGIFGDVPCPAFWAANWVEDLYNRGITAGCSASPLLYCPNDNTTRSPMAVFVQKTFGMPMCAWED